MTTRLSPIVLAALFAAAVAVSFVLSGMIDQSLFSMADQSQDVWFDSDTRIVAMNMTIREYHHWTLYKHPLFSLITWPLTSLARLFVGDAMTAVRVVQASNAGFAVVLLFTLLGRIGLGLLDRSLICLLFLVSGTMLFWYTVPETFTFGGTTLLIALHATISGRPQTRLGYLGLGLASLASLSMTITNWFAGLLATAIVYGLLDHPIALLKRWLSDFRTIWSDIKVPVLISVAVLVTAMALALLQDFIFGEASLFFNVFYIWKEGEFIGDYKVSSMILRPFVLLFSPVVVGTIDTWLNGTRMTADDFVPSNWPGILALGLWILLLVSGTISSVAALLKPTDANVSLRRLIFASAIILAAFIFIHTVYGFVAFLYLAHTAPYVLTIAAIGFLGKFRNVARIVITTLIVLAGYNNYQAFLQAAAFVRDTLPDLPLP
ncbi:hypothetical protein [Devosia beringensis]|uniref:hypothetical protein n=1 Tax=Devosia beringensis TaxID=2657486 RepID=UPI00186B771E|nr:hypothetical protein [Devosia beringensis]